MTIPQFVAGTVLTAAQLNAIVDEVNVVNGLVLVKTQTIGTTVSSVAVTNAFSATYDSYKIIVSGGAGSTSADLRMVLGASATAYYFAFQGRTYAGAANSGNGANATSWLVGNGQTDGLSANIEIVNPFLADQTYYTSQLGTIITTGSAFVVGGYHNSAVSYADFTLSPSTGTLTGGEIRVYGYVNS